MRPVYGDCDWGIGRNPAVVLFPGGLYPGVHLGRTAGHRRGAAIFVLYPVNESAARDYWLSGRMGTYDNLHSAFFADKGFYIAIA